VFTPPVGEMYPPGFQTSVVVEEVTKPLEGVTRPGHFKGVATVVCKLFNIVQPHRAYFGQKDAQQAVVIRRMARDLDFDLEVVVCPTVREPDGLAMSSRNVYLNPEERRAATVLFRARGRLSREEGQTTAEYALVILAAAAIAVVLIAWAHSSGKLPAFFDQIINDVTGNANAA